MVNKIAVLLFGLLMISFVTAQSPEEKNMTIQDWAERTLVQIEEPVVVMTRDSDLGEDCFVIDEKKTCFRTSEYAHVYYKVMDDNVSVKFGWKVENATLDYFEITANKPINSLNRIDWSDFNTSGLIYSITDNIIRIENPELTDFWFDPVINTTVGVEATANSNQRKVIQMPNGNIYTTYRTSDTSSGLWYVVLAKSTDYGTTWTLYNLTTGSLTVRNGFISMILGTDDTIIHLVWDSMIDATDSNDDIAYAQWNTTSGTLIGITNAYNATSATTEAYNPDIAILDNGTMGITYMKEDDATPRSDIAFKQCGSNCLTYASWSAETIIVDASANYGNNNQRWADIETNGTNWFVLWGAKNTTHDFQGFANSSDGTTWTREAILYDSATSFGTYEGSLIIKNNVPMVIGGNGNAPDRNMTFTSRNATAWQPRITIYPSGSTSQFYPQLSTDGTNLYAVWAGTNGLNSYSEENFTTGTTYNINNVSQQWHGWRGSGSTGMTSQITNDELYCIDAGTSSCDQYHVVQQTNPSRIDFGIKSNDTTKTCYFHLMDYVQTNFITSVDLGSGKIQYDDGSVKNVTTASNNVYYNLSLRNINWTGHKYDIYVNDVLNVSAVGFKSSSANDLGYMTLQSSNSFTGYKCYLDNVKIYNSTISSTNYHSVMFSNSSNNGTTWSTPTELGNDWALTDNANLYPNLPYQYGRSQALSVLYTKSWDANANPFSNEVVWESLGVLPNPLPVGSVNITPQMLTPVNEGTTQTFNLSILWNSSTDDITDTFADFYWNNTLVNTTKVNSSFYNATVPIGYVGTQTIPTSWNYTLQYSLINGTSNITANANQQVNKLNDTITVSTTTPTTALETQTVTSYLNLSYGSRITGITNVSYTWNGTAQPINILGIDQYSSYKTIPTLNSSINVSSYWTYMANYIDNTTTWFNTSLTNTSINIFNLSNATGTGYNATIKFRVIDETTGTEISTVVFSDIITVWVDNPSLTKNYSLVYANGNNFTFYKYPSGTNLTANIDITYRATNYDQRTYSLTSQVLTDTLNTVTLYLAPSNSTVPVQIIVTDSKGTKLQGITVKVLKDVGNGSTIITGSGVTSFDGVFVTDMIPYTTNYYFAFYTGSTYISQTAYARKISSYDITNGLIFALQLGADELQGLKNLIAGGSGTNLLYFNNATNTYTYVYNDPTGTVQQGCLKVIRMGWNMNATISDTCSSGSSGIVTYAVNTVGETEVSAWGYEKSNTQYNSEGFITTPPLTIYLDSPALGNLGMFWGLIIMVIIGFAGIWRAPVAIAGLVVAMLITTAMHLYLLSFTGIILIGVVALIWFIYKRD